MKKAFYTLVIPLLLIVSSINAYSQSNKGTEFWTCYMDHIAGVTGTGASSMVLYITSDISTTGSVDLADRSFSQAFTVTANTVTFVTIPASAFLGNTNGVLNKGIHITSVKPIAVYAHIYASAVSGATLLLPVNAMGKDYLSLNYTQISNANPSYSTFAVIATEDNTTVSITPSATLLDGTPAGTAFTKTLNKGQVYQGLSLTDLTGTKIQSISTTIGTCKKIAVFSGSSKIGIGCVQTGSSDNLFQQVYPTSTWGKNYIAAPLKNRPYDVYRIVLSSSNTTVTLNGAILNAAQFTNGLYYEFPSTTTNVISADKPIQVVQYSATQNQTINCASNKGDVGDPEMIYLSPIEQGLDQVTLYSTGYYNILQSYINVVIPTTAVSSFMLDGVAYTNFIAITNSIYSYAQIPVTSGPRASGAGGTVTSGTHTIKASVPFNAIAYGFGNTESYGYAAGANLQDLNEYVAIQDPQNPTTTLTAGCSNVSYKLQVIIPYQTTNISWKVDGATTFVDNAPVYTSTLIKGNTTLYVYEKTNVVNFTAGIHAVIATVFNPVADVCGSYSDIEDDLTITDPAVSSFTVGASNCLGDITTFTDATAFLAGNSAKTWLWDFGDNTTSTLQNPVHTYTAGGTYSTHLAVTDINGCSTVSAAKSVHIIDRPIAAFTNSTPDCAGQNITFSNTSTTAEGIINKWSWDFGDGTNSDLTTGLPFVHSYTTAGTYIIKLTITTDLGCSSDVLQKTIVVNPLPVVDFILPDVCLNDAFAQFTDASSIADHSESGFTYLWDFGDANSILANQTSTLKNPQHIYSQASIYTVKLTVTSQNGCVASKQQSFTVNGSTPKADFRVENNCSGDDIIFDDLSTVDFGNITKIVWYFDYNGNPGTAETYTMATMPANKKYTHHYPIFYTPAQQTYNIRMEVYSGGICTNTISKNIVINANPSVTLMANNNPVGTSLTFCQADAAIQIAENKGIYNGTGVFSGPGISSTGLFDPKVSGIGTFTINYLFTATTTACTYGTTFQVTVNTTPAVTIPAEYTVLDGGEVTLAPVATISNGTLTYKWTPSAGLSRDDIAGPIASPSADTKYTLMVSSDKGCSAAAQTLVTVLKSPVVPNTFTPNGDGINDTWDIKYLSSYPHCTIEVLNRYGERVYFSNNYPVAWDGRYKGADLPVGTYYYIINPNSGRKPITGYLTIIR
ncbi:PKD domain-containing protein [Mucilaginibacter sp.]|uniref:PKD domain-containing protein n=1 Tax=Mucilaginibacter sp. TaxID=1882438 RepID=UPI0026375F49|nr:PKD domain-containing protein [Mucilaginibacter sp.]